MSCYKKARNKKALRKYVSFNNMSIIMAYNGLLCFGFHDVENMKTDI